MRVLTSQSETGAVILALPQDVQAEAFEQPAKFFEKRVWTIPRPRCDRELLSRAAQWIRASRRPLIIAGGGGFYSPANLTAPAIFLPDGFPARGTQACQSPYLVYSPRELRS